MCVKRRKCGRTPVITRPVGVRRPSDTNKYNESALDVPITIGVQVYIRGVSDVRPEAQRITVQITMRQFWTDPRLNFTSNRLEYVDLACMYSVEGRNWHISPFQGRIGNCGSRILSLQQLIAVTFSCITAAHC